MSDTKHTVTLDNGHVIRKSDLAFNKTQTSVPSNFSAVPNPLINNHDLAGKRKRKSLSKRPDSNAGGPSTSFIPTGGKATKRRRTNTPSTKGSKFAFINLDTSLEVDLWDKVIDDYLGTDSETVSNTLTVNLHSDLDQPRINLPSQTNTQTTITIPTGTSDDPNRLDSRPEKTLETPKTPVSIKPRSRRNPGPPKFYGDRRFIDQVTLETENGSVAESDDEPLITFSSLKSPRTQTNYSTASPSDYLTPVEDIPRHPTLVAETSHGPSSTPTSGTTNVASLPSPLVEVGTNIQDDDGSDISSGIGSDARREADSFHDRFNAKHLNSENS